MGKKGLFLVVVMSLVLAVGTSISFAASRQIGATASVGLFDVLYSTVARIDANDNPSDDVFDNNNSLDFGSHDPTEPVWNALPAEYVHVSVKKNNPTGWRLRIASDNFSTYPSTTVWGFAYGGMIGTTAGAKVPMGWLVNPTSISNGPAKGDPGIVPSNGWLFLTDKHNQDDPANPGNQAWVDIDLNGNGIIEDTEKGIDNSGYANIAYGGAGYTRIIRPNVPGQSEELSSPTATFYLYLEASFNGAAGDNYTGTIWLDLLNL